MGADVNIQSSYNYWIGVKFELYQLCGLSLFIARCLLRGDDIGRHHLLADVVTVESSLSKGRGIRQRISRKARKRHRVFILVFVFKSSVETRRKAHKRHRMFIKVFVLNHQSMYWLRKKGVPQALANLRKSR